MDIKFNDGMEFDTSGDYRVIRKSDGLYVVGNGMLIAVDSYKEGWNLIEDMKKSK